MKEGKSKILELRIDWSEQDLFGHVNNVSFFKYLQSARVNFWEEIGFLDKLQTEHIGPMLASAKCEFKSPLFYPGKIKIVSFVDLIGNSSFGLCHEIHNKLGALAAIGKDIIVNYDFKSEIKLSLEPKVKEILKQYLRKNG